jgi:hypothetical protein
VEAAVDFMAIDDEYRRALDALVEDLRWAKTAASRRLAAQAVQLAADRDLEGLAALSAGAVGVAELEAAGLLIAEFGRNTAVQEAAAQGVKVKAAKLPAATAERVATRAQASALQLGSALSNSASQRALSAVGAGADAAQVGELVAKHLDELSDAQLTYSAQGTLSGALGEGRSDGQRAADEAATTPGRYYGSSMLDANACGPCVDADGQEFTSLEEAEQVYPGGSHNVNCEGGDRCRCLVVQVFGSETEATV